MRAAACIAVVIALAGCSLPGGETASVDRGQLQNLVLQPADLQRVFVRFDEGPQRTADSPGGRRGDAARFGRIGGWKARYRRPGTGQTAGPLVIESRADLFESSAGAEDDFAAARADLAESPMGWKPIGEPGVADESFAATAVQAGIARVRHYHVFWRRGNVTASLTLNGFEGKLAFSDALALAREQQRRIARAGSA